MKAGEIGNSGTAGQIAQRPVVPVLSNALVSVNADHAEVAKLKKGLNQ